MPCLLYSLSLSQLVRLLPLHGAKLSLKLVFNINVEIARVLVIGLARQGTGELLAGIDSEHVLQIKHSLFPVGVFAPGACEQRGSSASSPWQERPHRTLTSRKHHRLVAMSEFHIKVANQGVAEVLASKLNAEGNLKGQVFLLHSLNVNFLYKEVGCR